jgi:SEC-C motif
MHRRQGVFVPHTAHRNDPCPCGSGKKYKKCCMLEARNLAGVRAANREVVQEAVNWISLKHGAELADWVKDVWFAGIGEEQRKGISTAEASIKHIHDTNLLEQLMAEGVFTIDESATPVMQLILDTAVHLTETQRDYLQQLAARPLRLYRVSESKPGDSFSLPPCPIGDGETFCIEDKWVSRMLDVGDSVGLRLMHTGGKWETSGAVYHIPDEYVSDLLAELEQAAADNYCRTLIRYWLGLVAEHV